MSENENQPGKIRNCHNCKGVGKVTGTRKGEGVRKGTCLYCKGKGYRTNPYGVDK